MSDEKTNIGSTDDQSGPIDLAAEWSELTEGRGWFRGSGDSSRGSQWFFPVLLLYTGFFFGPFITVFAAVFALKGRISVRHAALLVGIAGTAWCLLQGISILKGASWSEYELQGMRSTFNFIVGIVAYITVRKPVVRMYRPTRVTVIISTVAILFCAVVFLLIPSDLLIAMGR